MSGALEHLREPFEHTPGYVAVLGFTDFRQVAAAISNFIVESPVTGVKCLAFLGKEALF